MKGKPGQPVHVVAAGPDRKTSESKKILPTVSRRSVSRNIQLWFTGTKDIVSCGSAVVKGAERPVDRE